MTDRVLMTAGRLKISRPGIDVKSTDNPGSLLFDSNYTIMRVWQAGTGTMQVDPNATSVPFPTLPSKPFATCLINYGTAGVWCLPNEETGGHMRFGIFVSVSSFGIRSYDGNQRPFRYTIWYPR